MAYDFSVERVSKSIRIKVTTSSTRGTPKLTGLKPLLWSKTKTNSPLIWFCLAINRFATKWCGEYRTKCTQLAPLINSWHTLRKLKEEKESSLRKIQLSKQNSHTRAYKVLWKNYILYILFKNVLQCSYEFLFIKTLLWVFRP